MKLNNVFPVLDPETAGTAPIPQALAMLKDRELAQRLATAVFGADQAVDHKRDPNRGIEVIEHVGFDVGQGIHEVAYVKRTMTRYDGEPLEYFSLHCAHDLIHLRDDRFKDENGNAIHSGLSSGSDIACPAKELACQLKRQVIMAEFYADKEFTQHDSLIKGKLPQIVLNLLKRYEAGEWIGISANNSMYVQHVEELLDIDFSEANRLCVLLEDQGYIERSGNIIMLPRVVKPQEKPSRLWATYSEMSGGGPIFETFIYTPANDLEPQDIRVETYKRDDLYEVIQYELQKRLTPEGDLSEKEQLHLQYVLSRGVDTWRKPYAFSQNLKLNRVKNLPKYERLASEQELDVTIYPYGHGNLSSGDFGDWYCSVCETSGDGRDSPSDFECIEK